MKEIIFYNCFSFEILYFLLLCVFMCVLSATFWINLLSQMEHVKGRSPVCVMTWFFSVSDLAKDWLQCGHINVLTPKCTIFMCRFIFTRRVNTDEHNSHGNWRSGLWYFMCSRKSRLVVFSWPHIEQTKFLIPLWRILCSFSLCFAVNIFGQISHLNGVSLVWV